MTRIIILAGEPCSGKSTIMRSVLAKLSSVEHHAPTPYQNLGLKGHAYPVQDILILGTYAPGAFPGTDRLAMNVAPQAVALIKLLRQSPTPRALLFEGDRLFTRSILDAAKQPPHERHLITLHVTPETLQQRRIERAGRAHGQSEAWARGRATKLTTLLAASPDVRDYIARNDNHAESEAITSRISSLALTARRSLA